MAYEVIKIVNGRPYRYLQRSYRANGRVRTESIYLGPLEPKRQSAAREFIDALVKKPKWEHTETEAEQRERIKQEDRERAVIDRNNEILTASSITLEEMDEVISSQHEEAPASEPSSNESEPPAAQ